MTNPKDKIATDQTSVTETTDAGQQFVIDGYRPVSQRERLEQMARLPMGPKRFCLQKPCDIGLFDEVTRNQMELF